MSEGGVTTDGVSVCEGQSFTRSEYIGSMAKCEVERLSTARSAK